MHGSRSRRINDERNEQRTIQEWSSRIERLNSIDSGQIEPKVSSPYSKGALGYAGFYHYLTSNSARPSHKSSSSSTHHDHHHPKRPTNFERWISVKKSGPGHSDSRRLSQESEPCLINQSEMKDIQRCFQAADVEGSGWLDCEGFKIFMSMRGAPITHLDARKLLKVIDHKSQRFISFDQVMYLVVHCGITTDHEVPITSEEFNRILNRMRLSSMEKESKVDIWPQHNHPHPSYAHHRRPHTVQHHNQQFQAPRERDLRPRTSRVIQNSYPMDHSRSFFEEMASEVQIKANEERLYKEYRREMRHNGTGNSRRREPPVEQPEWEGPPAWKNLVLHSQDPNYHVPPIVFKDLHKDWEVKSRNGVEDWVNNGKDGRSPRTETSKSPPPHSAFNLKIEGSPKGIPASAFCIPGRPQPFVVTQTELQIQLDKIRKKNELAEGSQVSAPAAEGDKGSEPKTDLLFKADAKVKGSESRVDMSIA